tara:strand:+ start:291 stop:503 length:213 start_codon:yes stop_codon:yes gene_type:complete
MPEFRKGFSAADGPVVTLNDADPSEGYFKIFPDTDGKDAEIVELSASVSHPNGTVTGTSWVVNRESVGGG